MYVALLVQPKKGNVNQSTDWSVCPRILSSSFGYFRKKKLVDNYIIHAPHDSLSFPLTTGVIHDKFSHQLMSVNIHRPSSINPSLLNDTLSFPPVFPLRLFLFNRMTLHNVIKLPFPLLGLAQLQLVAVGGFSGDMLPPICGI